MANTQSNSESSSSWWSYLKEKSETIVKIYKEDLKEFTATISNDTKTVIQQAKSSRVESKLNNFLGFKSKEEINEIIVDRYKAKILALQNDENTYSDIPNTEDYQTWKQSFNLQEKSQEISELLKKNATMQKIYTQLVPNSISYEIFWGRYYYRLFKLNQEEDRRANLIKKSKDESNEEEIGWEEIDETKTEQQNVVNVDELDSYLNQLDETTEKPSSPTEVKTKTTEIKKLDEEETTLGWE